MPYPVMLGRAFMEFLERMNTTGLPSHAGSPFTIVVTLDYDTLLAQLGIATLHTGDPHGGRPGGSGPPGMRISAGEARRLACTAGIFPMVLGGDSMPLDVGREKRLFTRYQRIALAHTYHGCAAHGCDRPPGWAEIHHTDPWRGQGNTNLDDGLPLCPTHHHMADHPTTWQMTTLPNRKVTFTRHRPGPQQSCPIDLASRRALRALLDQRRGWALLLTNAGWLVARSHRATAGNRSTTPTV